MKIKFDLLLNCIAKLFSVVIKAQGTQTRRKVGLTGRLQFLFCLDRPTGRGQREWTRQSGPTCAPGASQARDHTAQRRPHCREAKNIVFLKYILFILDQGPATSGQPGEPGAESA